MVYELFFRGLLSQQKEVHHEQWSLRLRRSNKLRRGSIKRFQNLEDRAQNFESLARDLTNNLYILLRSAGIYDLDNQALDQPFSLLLGSVSGLYDLLKSDISIRLSDGNFFVNRRLVKLDFSTYQNARYLIKS